MGWRPSRRPVVCETDKRIQSQAAEECLPSRELVHAEPDHSRAGRMACPEAGESAAINVQGSTPPQGGDCGHLAVGHRTPRGAGEVGLLVPAYLDRPSHTRGLPYPAATLRINPDCCTPHAHGDKV
jgi:hypothetical protein